MRISSLNNENMRKELLCIVKNFAYSKRDVTLSSGQTSNFYIDCKQISFRGDGACALGQLFFEVMADCEKENGIEFAAYGGMALGAVPISIALTQEAFKRAKDLPSVCVRKDIKTHGTAASVEGFSQLEKGARVLLVEDVITTGNATLKAAQALRERAAPPRCRQRPVLSTASVSPAV